MLPLIKTISSLTKIAKASHKLPSMIVKLTRACPFTSNSGASYQINGKIAPLKGRRKEQLKTFRVDRFALSYSLAHDKNFYTYTSISKHFQKTKHFVYVLIETRTIAKPLFKTLFKTRFTNTSLNHFSKQNFVYVLIETRTITKRFSKILSKPTPQAHNQNKSKWSKTSN